MNSSQCRLEFDSAIKAIKDQVLAELGDSEASRVLRSAMDETLDKIDDIMKAAVKSTQLRKHAVEQAEIQILHAINTQRAFTALQNRVGPRMLKAKDSGEIKKMIEAEYDNILASETREINMMAQAIDDSFSSLYKRGFDQKTVDRTKRMFLKHMTGSDNLAKYFNDTLGDDASYIVDSALKAGRYDGLSELDILAKVFHMTDDHLVSRMAANNVPFQRRANHTRPIKPVREMILGKKKEYAEDLMDKLDFHKILNKEDLSAAEIAKYIKDRVEYDLEVTNATGGRKFKLDASRELVFKNARAEFDYAARWGDPSQDIIRTAFGHRMDMVKKASAYNKMGADPTRANQFVIDMARARSRELGNKGFKNIDDIDGVVSTYARKAGVGQIDDTSVNTSVENTIKTIRNFMSTGLTPYTLGRDFFFDKTMHPAQVRSTVTGENAMWLYLKNLGTFLNDMAFGGRRVEELKPMIQAQGIGVDISINSMMYGERALNKMSEASPWVRGSRNLSDFAHVVSGAQRGNKLDRTRRAISSGRMILEALKLDFDDIPKLMKDQAAKLGITKADWDDLKKVGRYEHHQYGEFMLKFDDITATARKGELETQSVANNRLKDAYNGLWHNLTDFHSTTGNRLRGEPQLFLKNDILNQASSQFFRMPLSQNRSLQEAYEAAYGLGGGRGDLMFYWALARKSPAAFVGLMSTMATGAWMTTWGRDVILEGRSPRDITVPENWVAAMAETGMGGIYALMASRLYYNGDFVATTLPAATREVERMYKAVESGEEEKILDALRKMTKRVPVTNAWYAHAMLDTLFYEYLGAKESNYVEDINQEKGRERGIDLDIGL